MTADGGQAPDFFSAAVPVDYRPTRDPFWQQRWDPERGMALYADYPLAWGFNAIRIPTVWSTFGNHPRTTRVGVIDSAFFAGEHQDLNIIRDNILIAIGDPQSLDHGHMVAGIIAATHDNELMMAGVVNLDPYSLFASAHVPENHISLINSLFWLVANGAKIVNVSLSNDFYARDQDGRNSLSPNIHVNSMMRFLLDMEYDFIVVQSAGNDTEDATDINRVFSAPDLRSRIITVGAHTRYNIIWHDNVTGNGSNWGSMVDVVAPGSGIFTLTRRGNTIDSGTSFAAPFVAGTAALAWSENPGHNGVAIRNFIVETAMQRDPIIDTRDGRNNPYWPIDAYRAVTRASIRIPYHEHATLLGHVISARREGHGTLGGGIAGAVVRLYRQGVFIAEAVTDSQGFFRISEIEPYRDGFFVVTWTPLCLFYLQHIPKCHVAQ